MKRSITIKNTIQINSDRVTVWNFTQNFDLRSSWDESVTYCKVQQRKPNKIVHLKMLGGIVTKLNYKLCRKPTKTSLKLSETKSFLFDGGGGSWRYYESDNQTQWTQINTLTFRNEFIHWLLAKPTIMILTHLISKSMKNAKNIIEENYT